MAAALIANYPDKFDAAAIIAGIGYPCANGLMAALKCMKSGPDNTPAQAAIEIKNHQPATTAWPKLTVIAGTADTIVNPINSQHIAEQWAKVIGAEKVESVTDKQVTITTYKNNYKTLTKLP